MTLALALSLSIAVFGTGALIAARLLIPRKVPRPVRWPAPPHVYVSSDLPASYVLAVGAITVRWWERRHDTAWGGVWQTPEMPPMHCIFVDLRGQEFAEDHIGETRRVTNGDFITSAIITVPSNLSAEKIRDVLDHEMGHALGYNHASWTGSIMAPFNGGSKQPQAGSDAGGLEGP